MWIKAQLLMLLKSGYQAKSNNLRVDPFCGNHALYALLRYCYYCVRATLTVPRVNCKSWSTTQNHEMEGNTLSWNWQSIDNLD